MPPHREASITVAKPIFPWFGGKSNKRHLDNILPRIPKGIDTYYEPFLGLSLIHI